MSKPEFTLRTGIYPAIEPEQFKGSLAGKVALVTGSGRGIGREIAFALARSGAAVGVSGRTKAEVDETTKEVLALGVKAIGLTADICVRSELERLVKDVFNIIPASQTLANLLRLRKVSVLSTSSSAMREQTRLCHFT
jgi:NAD(P)-dependent dehydrogenase (short-subunit alcohol dehydrogenase family)